MRNTSSFSLRQIPTSFRSEENNDENAFFTDKVKILEFSNSIDEWEENILFGENGFFTLKGKDVENKSKEYLSELESFINSKFSELNLADASSKEIFLEIKQEKINAIKNQMDVYTKKELKEWQLQVFEKAIEANKKRAVLYKNNPSIVDVCMKNGLTVINLISEQEKWSSGLTNRNYEKFKSEFYSELISAFILEKDINACILFDRYQDLLEPDKNEEFESLIEDLKVNIIAYNWSKELFSYKLEPDEQEEEFKRIEDDDIRAAAKSYMKVFQKNEKYNEEEKQKQKNAENWKVITSNLGNNTGNIFLDIDYSLDKKSTEKKKSYIKQISEKGYITTNAEDYLALLEEFSKDTEAFKRKDISDYTASLSNEDYNFFIELQKDKDNECLFINADYYDITNGLKQEKITKSTDKYNVFKLFFAAVKNYEKTNNKTADLKTRNDILENLKSKYNKEAK